jgi:hypothetical protein
MQRGAAGVSSEAGRGGVAVTRYLILIAMGGALVFEIRRLAEACAMLVAP